MFRSPDIVCPGVSVQSTFFANNSDTEHVLQKGRAAERPALRANRNTRGLEQPERVAALDGPRTKAVVENHFAVYDHVC